MPDRFTHSVPFTVNGVRYVQIGDAKNCCVCLVPHTGGIEGYERIKYVCEALNLKDTADKIAPKSAAVLALV